MYQLQKIGDEWVKTPVSDDCFESEDDDGQDGYNKKDGADESGGQKR